MHRVIICIALAALCGCAGKNSDAGAARLHPNTAIPLIRVVTDGHPGVIFPKERGQEVCGVGEVGGFWTPSSTEVEMLEHQLRPFLTELHAKASRASHNRDAYTASEIGSILDHWGSYRRQYVGFTVGKSRRILVNSCPVPFPDGFDPVQSWDRVFVYMMDGGFWYWRVQYDVERKRFLEFESNGYA